MVMIVGLKSGYQIVVKENFYLFGNNETGLLTHVFVSEDEKRLITVPPEGSIEFTDEPATKEAIKNLDQTVAALTSDKIPKEVEHDPNVG